MWVSSKLRNDKKQVQLALVIFADKLLQKLAQYTAYVVDCVRVEIKTGCKSWAVDQRMSNCREMRRDSMGFEIRG